MKPSEIKRVERCQTAIVFRLPFFAPAVCTLPVSILPTDDPRWAGTPGTAFTDGKAVTFRQSFFDGLSDRELCTVLCHEAAHCLFGHLWRKPAGADGRWNQACDHAVNLMLKEFSEGIVQQGLADPFPFPAKYPPLADPQFVGMAEEKIYGLLPEGGAGDKPGNQLGGGDGVGEFVPSPGEEGKADQTRWQETLIQCAAAAKACGKLPGDMARRIGELLDPQVPWFQVLANMLRELCDDDYNWMRPNQYFDETGFILPSLESERLGPVVFCIDTSGSIDETVLRHFRSEEQACLDDLSPSKVVEICGDTAVTSFREFRRGDRIVGDCNGGGGTDFRPLLERAAEVSPSPRAVVFLTDLYGAFPDTPPDFEVIWVTYGGTEAPFGTVIPVSPD